LNVRTGPSINYNSVDRAYNGQKVTVYATNGSWSRIHASKARWVSSSYLKACSSSSSGGSSSSSGSNNTKVCSSGYSCSNGYPLFGQCDSSWTGDVMAPGYDTLCQSGCALTSLAMIYSKLSGKLITPREMNNCVVNNGGYNYKSWITWEVPAKCGGGKIVNDRDNFLSPSDISSRLNSGKGLVIQVDGHYMAVTGVNGNTLYINDPGNGQTTTMSYNSNSRTFSNDKYQGDGRFIVYSM